MKLVAEDGYTGLLFLYEHTTRHVIVRWTGSEIDSEAKIDTEDALLTLITGLFCLFYLFLEYNFFFFVGRFTCAPDGFAFDVFCFKSFISKRRQCKQNVCLANFY